ncbi:CheY-like superfamily [Blastocladiella britannica]|nr:CheY-like superfamily [Blastocladiella britannica]
MTSRLLERAGISVRVAEHGQEALDMLRDKNSDLATDVQMILMDLQMPVMGGIECTEIIRREESGWQRANGRRLPIVALTANAMAEERDRCVASGFDGFITKPVNRETLVVELRQLTSMDNF